MEISNADRVVFPEIGLTKGQVAAYYAAVTDWIYPLVEGRALTVQRFPKGVGAGGFMQKNAPSHFGEDLIERVAYAKEDGGETVYPVVVSPDAVVAYSNIGVITFHVPPVRVDSGWKPDLIIWDLDPSEGEVEMVREAALATKDTLNAFGIETELLASGSKGYHLRAPTLPTIDLETAAAIARGTANLAVAANPGLLTGAFRKKERGGAVFVDWLRNAALSTTVVPWSLRPTPAASVAAPMLWSELSEIEPDGVDYATAIQRGNTDVSDGVEPQDLSAVALRVEEALSEAGIVLEPFDRFRS